MDEVLYLRGAKENVLIMRKHRKVGTEEKRQVAQIGLEECRRELAQLREASSGMIHELDVARMIQRSLLPANLPQVQGFGLAGGWNCARGGQRRFLRGDRARSEYMVDRSSSSRMR